MPSTTFSTPKNFTKKKITLNELAVMIKCQFDFMDTKFAKIDTKFDGIEIRLDRIEARLDSIELTMVTKDDIKRLLK